MDVFDKVGEFFHGMTALAERGFAASLDRRMIEL